MAIRKMAGSIEIGQKFGRLTVREFSGYHSTRNNKKTRNREWKCDCECGGTRVVTTSRLRSGTVHRCQICSSNCELKVGSCYGYLTVMSRRGVNLAGSRTWNCRCICGGNSIVTTTSLRNGHTKSCGCKKLKTRNPIPIRSSINWLTVIENIKNTGGDLHVLCQCLCGALTKVKVNEVRSAAIRSCGCGNNKPRPKTNDARVERSCPKCNSILPATDQHFPKSRKKPYGILNYCRVCHRHNIRGYSSKRPRTIEMLLSARISSSIRQSIHDRKAGRKWESVVGYSVYDLIAHLEVKFEEGMSWENMGEWHIDHVTPKSWHVLKTDTDVKRCWALSNLQPMWSHQNQSKKNYYAGSYRNIS